MTTNGGRSRARSAIHVAKHARQIADAGDRWFLSVASGLGRLGGWARLEANIAADSAAAAFATTVGVAKKLTGRANEPAAPPPSSSSSSHAPCSDESAGDGSSSSWPAGEKVGLDLVPAVAVGLRHPSTPSPLESGALPSAHAPHPAGVVPLLQALGHTVASYTQKGYASLQQDDRFWTLIHLLQVLGRPTIASPDEGAPLHDDKPPDCERNPSTTSGVMP